MNYYLENGQRLTLSDKTFIAEGGQGSVHAIGNVAYKIYTNPATVMPMEKIKALSCLPTDIFSRPEGLVLDGSKRVVGYTLKFVKDCYILCQLFPKAFREREKLSTEQITYLVGKMREGFDIAHRNGILLVDPNEMNFLVSKDFRTLTFIDTDSYQTKDFPATAIMDSIRDRQMKHPTDFTEGSDWFSFAVIAFQMFFGLHPFKGRHPTLKTMDERMKANVSIFHRDVSLPKTTIPSTTVPEVWRKWFFDIFDMGERKPPPTMAAPVFVPIPGKVVSLPTPAPPIKADEIFLRAITLLDTFGSPYRFASNYKFRGSNGVYFANSQEVATCIDPITFQFSVENNTTRTAEVVPNMLWDSPHSWSDLNYVSHYDIIFSSRTVDLRNEFNLGILTGGIQNGRPYFYDFESRYPFQVMNRQSQSVYSLRPPRDTDWGGQGYPIVSVAQYPTTFRCLGFDGCVFWDSGNGAGQPSGEWSVSLFRDGATCNVKIPLLKDAEITKAKFEHNLKGAALLVDSTAKDSSGQAKTYTTVFRFSPDFKTHDARSFQRSPAYLSDIAILPKGVLGVLFTEYGTDRRMMKILSVVKDDPVVNTALFAPEVNKVSNLVAFGDNFLATNGNKVIRLTLK